MPNLWEDIEGISDESGMRPALFCCLKWVDYISKVGESNSLPPSIVNFSSLASFRNSLAKINFRIYMKY